MSDLDSFFDIYKRLDEKQRLLVEEFARHVSNGSVSTLEIRKYGALISLPTKAPELYKKRFKLPKAPREKIVPFMGRVYGEWLGVHGFTIAYVKHLDPSAGGALYTQSKRYGLPEHFAMSRFKSRKIEPKVL